MKTLLPFFFLLLFFAATAFSQQSALFTGLGKPLKNQKSGSTLGSPYLNDEFEKANVITSSGNSLKDLPLRYDISYNHIEYATENNIYDITNSVNAFTLKASENHTGKFIKLKNTDSKISGFLELVYNGNIRLYKLNSIKVISEENFYTKNITKKYVTSNIYYIASGDKFTKIDSSKKDYLNAFKSNEKVRAFLNSTDVDFNSDNSLTPLAKLIDNQ